MDAITAAVLNIAMDRQSQQLDSNASLVREAKKSDAAVLQLLDAAKALEQPSAGGQSSSNGSQASSGRGSILNLIA